MRWTVIGISGALALVACSSNESGSNASDKGGRAMTGGGQDQSTPSNLSDDPQNGVEPVSLPSPKPIGAIPAAFQGDWGQVVTDCEAGGKGLMVVDGSSLTLNGARAPLGSLHMMGDGVLAGQLAAARATPSRGASAQRVERLTLLDDGKTLVRQEQNLPALFRYSRCPA